MIKNKVQDNQKLVAVDLSKLFDQKHKIEILDITPWLFQGLLIKEHDFRKHIENHSWEQYHDSLLIIKVNQQALINSWAYMLLMEAATPFCLGVHFSDKETVITSLYQKEMDQYDWAVYQDKYVLIKGCSDHSIPASVFAYATQKLLGTAKKIMYGEACSFVPIHTAKS